MRWDYKTTTLPVKKSFDEDANKLLADMGDQEWELVNFQADRSLGKLGVVFFVFKRPAAPKPTPPPDDEALPDRLLGSAG